MQLKFKLYSLAALLLFLSGCAYDNFEAPSSFLTGRVLHQNEAIGVRNGAVRLELYQRGFALFNKVDLFVAQDGTFSASVFDGDYQITRLRGNGPWADQTDTITVTVKGNTIVDVPVSPYFVIKNPHVQKGNTTIDATFTLEQVNTSRQLERVNLYVGATNIVDANTQSRNVQKAASVVNLAQPITLNLNLSTLPAALATKPYVFARIGVKTVGVAELAYSQPVKIMLK